MFPCAFFYAIFKYPARLISWLNSRRRLSTSRGRVPDSKREVECSICGENSLA